MTRLGKIVFTFLCALSAAVLANTNYIKTNGLYADKDGSTTSKINNETLLGGNTMTLWFQVSDVAGFSNISYILVTFYDSAYASQNSTNSDLYKATYKYYRNDASWSILGPLSWGLDRTYSTIVSKTVTTNGFIGFKLVFTIGSLAMEEASTSWRINILVQDNEGNPPATNTSSWMLVQSPLITTGGVGSSEVFAYPNPVTISQNAKVSFCNAPGGFSTDCTGASLRVYTIFGELVKVVFQNMAFTGGTTLDYPWDGKNGAGNLVASGIYSAILEYNYLDQKGVKQTQRKTVNFAVYR